MDRGTYALLLDLREHRRLTVGKLGAFAFPAGYYVYIGSALNGLQHRLARHLRRGKILRWHVDYLREIAEVDEAWCVVGEERLECSWMETVRSWPGATVIAPGFGSSDCRCPAHLAYFGEKPNLSALGARLWPNPD